MLLYAEGVPPCKLLEPTTILPAQIALWQVGELFALVAPSALPVGFSYCNDDAVLRVCTKGVDVTTWKGIKVCLSCPDHKGSLVVGTLCGQAQALPPTSSLHMLYQRLFCQV